MLKKSIGSIGFRCVPAGSSMFVVSVTVYLPASHVSAYAGLSRGNGCATDCYDIWLSACLWFIAADPRHQTHWITTPPSPSTQV